VVNGVRNYFRVTAVSTNGVESAASNEESLVVNLVRPGENQLSGGDFSDGVSGWEWSATEASGARWWVTNGVSLVDPGDGLTQLSDVRLSQAGLRLLNGRRYVLEFEAWASLPRAMEVRVGLNRAPFTTWRSFTVLLSPGCASFDLFHNYLLKTQKTLLLEGFNLLNNYY